ncbi:uncharacterized protein [Rutidosis leptorrhynchoides]|uniref:uncharacterized protein n=1 Tax=Rutidosis leptorrhynchoides TaxID=125765 RepID=UPI003A99BF51
MRNFNEFISLSGLFDQHLSNGYFTWEGPEGKTSHIDHILLNTEWIEKWPDSFLITGDPQFSDHKPLILGKQIISWGPKPFRFYNFWFNKKGFIEMCKQKWDLLPFDGWATHSIVKKLRSLKADLKGWHMQEVRNARKDLLFCEQEIQRLKSIYTSRDLVSNELISCITPFSSYVS